MPLGGARQRLAVRPWILVVDDEPRLRELLAKALALAEWDVDTAPDGDAALEALRLDAYDLLIVDLKMPGMDGLSLIREASHVRTGLPVVIITGFSTEATAIEAVNLGVAAYLIKPFKGSHLLEAVAKALGRNTPLELLRNIARNEGASLRSSD